MSHLTADDERRLSYFAKISTRHPKNEQVLAWAAEIFPDRPNLRLKVGYYVQTIKGARRSGKRTALVDGDEVLGVGTDAVEAVAAADIEQKRKAVAKAAKENKL